MRSKKTFHHVTHKTSLKSYVCSELESANTSLCTALHKNEFDSRAFPNSGWKGYHSHQIFNRIMEVRSM